MRRPFALLGVAVLLAVLLSLLLAPGAAFGQVPERGKVRLSAEPKLGVALVGLAVPTGGVYGAGTARALYALDDSYGVEAGVGLDLYGLTGGWRNMGVIAGPHAGGWWRAGALQLGGGVGLPYGQLAVCRPWGHLHKQCVRWWNLWTKAYARAVYLADGYYVGAEAHALYLHGPFGGDDGGGGLSVVGSWR